MISYIFGLFFVIGIIYSILSGINISSEFINASNDAIKIIFNIVPVMCLWLGIMNIAKESGLLSKVIKFIRPLIIKLFPEIPRNSECIDYIATNVIMNMLGLGNVATPFGFKSIKEMQKLNKNKDIASRSMCTFLVMNTAAVTIMPSTIIGIRAMYGSVSAFRVVPYVIVTSTLSCIIGLILDRIFYKVTK